MRASSAVARPNSSSSFENPNTKPSPLSISFTSASSPSASDSMVLSSSPPNPAPSITTRSLTGRTYPNVESDGCHTRSAVRQAQAVGPLVWPARRRADRQDPHPVGAGQQLPPAAGGDPDH